MRWPSLDRFALALGAYVGVLVGTGFAFSVGRSLPSRHAVAVGLAALVAVLIVTEYVPDLSVAFAERRLHEVFATAPGAVMLVGIGLSTTEAAPVSVLDPAFLFPVVGSFVCGLVLFAVAECRRVTHVESHEAVRAEWTAIRGTRRQWRRKVAFVGLGAVLLAGGTVLWLRVEFVGSLVMGFGISAGLQAFDVGDSKRLRAHESGLTIRDSRAVVPSFVPWSRFTGYERTENALVLRRRLPLTGYRCALDRVDDPDAAEAALRDALE